MAEPNSQEVAKQRIAEASVSAILDLSGLKLESVPESIGQLSQLTELRLDGNQVRVGVG